jgi:hypothetical protein
MTMSRFASFALLVAFGAAFGGALCATSALAQNSVGIAGAQHSSQRAGRLVAPQGRRSSLIGLSGTPLQAGMRRRYGRDRFSYGGWPYSAPDYAGAYPPELIEPSPAPQAAPVPPTKLEPVPSGALLELQGSHWVKVESFGSVSALPEGSSHAIPGPIVSASAAKEIPASVLVYRDGRTEELRSYSIIGTTMYTKADYWSTGAWTRKIQIADLDLPATIEKNRERGLGFQLPSGPDEVILRP